MVSTQPYVTLATDQSVLGVQPTLQQLGKELSATHEPLVLAVRRRPLGPQSIVVLLALVPAVQAVSSNLKAVVLSNASVLGQGVAAVGWRGGIVTRV